MKEKLKAHPLTLFDLIKPFVFVLVLPFIRSAVSFLYSGVKSGISVYEAVAFLILIVIAEKRRKCMSISLENGKIILKSGFYFKNESTINKNLISSVYIKANPIERMFSVKTVYINTESGNKKRPDYKIKLKVSDAEKLFKHLSTGEIMEKRRYSALKVAFWAAAASSSFSGILIGAPAFHRAAKLLGVGLYDALLEGAAKLGERFFRFFPAAVNVVTVVLLFVYLIAFLYQLLKNLCFTVLESKNSVTVKSGIFVKRQTVILIKSIKAIIIEQPLLMRIFGCFTAKAAVGGYGGKYAGNALLAPTLKAVDIKGYKEPTAKTVKLRFGRISAILSALGIGVGLLMVSGILLYFYFDFARLIIFATIISVAVLVIYSDMLLYSYQKGSLFVDKSISAVGTSGLKRKMLCFNKESLGEIKLRENPFDRRRGSARARIFVFSKGEQSINLRWINKSQLKKSVLNLYE